MSLSRQDKHKLLKASRRRDKAKRRYEQEKSDLTKTIKLVRSESKVSLAEVAEILNVSRQRVHQMIKED